MAINQVMLIGRLTRKPELKNADDTSKMVCKFSVALDRGKGKNGEDLGADYPNVVAFGKTAQNCEKYLDKGRLVAIVGRIRTGSYENKEGKKVYTTEVYADRVEFLEWGDKAEGKKEEQQSIPSGFSQFDDSDIPF